MPPYGVCIARICLLRQVRQPSSCASRTVPGMPALRARARCCAGETSGDSSPGITAEADVGTEDSEMDWPNSEEAESVVDWASAVSGSDASSDERVDWAWSSAGVDQVCESVELFGQHLGGGLLDMTDASLKADLQGLLTRAQAPPPPLRPILNREPSRAGGGRFQVKLTSKETTRQQRV